MDWAGDRRQGLLPLPCAGGHIGLPRVVAKRKAVPFRILGMATLRSPI